MQFDTAIFRILPDAIDNLLEYFKKQQTGSKLKPQLTKLLQKIHHVLTQFNDDSIDEESKIRISQVINQMNLKIYERDVKEIWDKYTKNKNVNILLSELDEFFIDNNLYHEIEEEKPDNTLKIIKQEDIHLVCFEWFKPE